MSNKDIEILRETIRCLTADQTRINLQLKIAEEALRSAVRRRNEILRSSGGDFDE